MPPLSLDNPAYYLNRLGSWLAFNTRVLQEAVRTDHPLLERLKFLAISASNLDEFFEIQVASLLQRIEDGPSELSLDGLLPGEERDLVARETHAFVAAQYSCWNHQLRPELAAEGIRIHELRSLGPAELEQVAAYCRRELDPLLTPITIDPAHPFPHVINKALCLALLLRRKRRSSPVYLGVVTVPRILPRLVRLSFRPHTADYLSLAELVEFHAAGMYRGFEILSSAAFRVTRNSNLYLQEEESRNLLETVRDELHHRRRGNAVRLEIDSDADPEIIERLRSNFQLDEWQIFRTPGPVNLSRLMALYDENHRPELKFRPFVPRPLKLRVKSQNLFDELRQRDILLHHPFDSYQPVVDFIRTAADDPNVLSIKQTLYRTSADSPIVDALMDAAQAGKQVSVVVELKARFDETSNINWARHMEDAGVQVFHGVVGLKTHCKLALLVRRDLDGITRQYAHLGTGNYNPSTARFYTDLSLLTSNAQMTTAVQDVFGYLTAHAEYPGYEPLLVAPQYLAASVLDMIAREAGHARAGRPARIIAKVNGLLDQKTIAALYGASQAGVDIELFVRGMCALRPGVRGVSGRIRVRSVVGRFLEHSRIFMFANGGAEEIYLGSADLMPRNLYERVEVVFPVRSPSLRERLRDEIVAAYLADTTASRILQPNGTYLPAAELVPAARRLKKFSAQQFFIMVAEGKAGVEDIPAPLRSRPAARPRKSTTRSRR